MKKILFVTHDTSRTGAPKVLLSFLQWMRDYKPDTEITVVALKGGDLSDEFKQNSKKFYDLSTITIPEETLVQNVKKRILKKLRKYKRKLHPKEILIENLAKDKFDLLYANSVVSVPLACKIKKLSPTIKLLVHVHELNSIISVNLPDFGFYLEKINRIIAVSEVVKRNLIETYGFQEEKIKIVNEFAQVERLHSIKKEGDFIVGGAGTAHWRKGSDLFIQVARHVKKKFPLLNIRFEWLGLMSEEEEIILKADIEKGELKETVFLLGPKDNPGDYYSNFDVFLLPSREDPFPLVAIEAGMLGKPIICFEKATGTAEVLKHGGGTIVPYLDIEAMSENVVRYYEDRVKLKEDGGTAKRLFSRFTPRNMCPQLYSFMKYEGDE